MWIQPRISRFSRYTQVGSITIDSLMDIADTPTSEVTKVLAISNALEATATAPHSACRVCVDPSVIVITHLVSEA